MIHHQFPFDISRLIMLLYVLIYLRDQYGKDHNMKDVGQSFGMFLFDLYTTCKSNIYLLIAAYGLLSIGVILFFTRKHVKNIFISYSIQETVNKMKKYSDPDKVDLASGNYLLGSGYSMFADVIAFVVRLILCIIFSLGITSEYFSNVSTVFLKIELKLSLLDYIKIQQFLPSLIAMCFLMITLQVALFYFYETELIGDHKIVDYISSGLLIVLTLLMSSGFVLVWFITLIGETIALILYKTVLWDMKLKKVQPDIERSLAIYNSRIEDMKQEAIRERQKRNKKKK